MNKKRKTIPEQIAAKREQIAQCEKRITSEQEKKDTFIKDLKTLESLEIQNLIKEINLPHDELKKFLNSMQPENSKTD